MTVPVEDVPPTTDVGFTLTDATVGAVIVSVAVWDVLFAVAVIVTVVLDATATVVIVKVALVAPAATVTVAGSLAATEVSLSVTEYPPVGAAEAKVTVPVEEVPPTTDVGLTSRLATVGAVIVRVAVFELLLAVAVMVALMFAETAVVVTVKVAVVAPATTVTDDGTVADVELLLRVTA